MKKHLIRPEDLSPKIAEGLTQGDRALEEANERFAPQGQDGIALVSHMRDVSTVAGTRVPTPRFVAKVNPDAVMVEESTGRVMADVTLVFMPETQSAVKAGMVCLRCLEPQAYSFPDACDLCGYPMRERQILDVAHEFVGDTHLGPSKPIQEYLDLQEARVEKRRRSG